LKLEKVRPTLSSLYSIPAKLTEKLLLLVPPDEICFISSSYLYGAFFVWVKGLRNNFSLEIT